MTTMTTTRQTPFGDLRMTPGRWVLLLIGVPVALALIAWTGFTFIADVGQASFPIADNIPVTNGQLSLSEGGGDLAVQTGTGSVARLTGRVQYSLVRPKFTENNTASGSTVGVSCRIPAGNCGLSARLEVPPRTAVTLSSGGGDLTVSGIQATETLNSYGGDMTVTSGAGKATLSTGGGDLNVRDLAGPLSLSTAGGDISGSGLTSPTVTAYSSGGDVALVFNQIPGNLNIVSSGGDIAIVLPAGRTAYAIATTSDGGDVGETVPVNPSSPDKITVDSGGGDIAITQAS